MNWLSEKGIQTNDTRDRGGVPVKPQFTGYPADRGICFVGGFDYGVIKNWPKR